MQNVCVFCGASPGKEPLFMDSAKALGAVISNASMGLIYGGAHVVLLMLYGEKVVGVIPKAFAKMCPMKD